ncbi:MAG: PTPA-CTERM sorting domain-containing protein [Leptolyngbyaceae cyanobacterium bins.302]|nr:PTPA-CTERM sorting domain-containing protein [Leptolyngbyaceae cyanobacterium bins.302]
MASSTILKTLTATVIGAACLTAGSAVDAYALTLTFDEIATEGSISNGYGGLNWDNFYVLNSTTFFGGAPNGYKFGTASPEKVAYNAFGAPASVLKGSQPFTLNSAYLTAAWNDGLNILIEGIQGINTVYSTTVVVDTTSPTLFNFNWSGIDSLRFTSFGGVNAGYGGGGTQFALDNLTINATPIPTPALLPGLIGMGVMALRKRKAEAAGQESEA